MKISGKGNLVPTGCSDRNMANNIYDLAGNSIDWTLEGTGGCIYRIGRGNNANWSDGGTGGPAGSRRGDFTLKADSNNQRKRI